MVPKLNYKKMSISAATSTLISMILKMPACEIIDTLEEIEKKTPVTKTENKKTYPTEVVYSVNKKFHKDFISNIDSNNIFINSIEKFETGQKITLSFELPDSNKHIKVNGKIVNTEPKGFGVLLNIENKNLMNNKIECIGSP